MASEFWRAERDSLERIAQHLARIESKLDGGIAQQALGFVTVLKYLDAHEYSVRLYPGTPSEIDADCSLATLLTLATGSELVRD
jgi:hypothetical protein